MAECTALLDVKDLEVPAKEDVGYILQGQFQLTDETAILKTAIQSVTLTIMVRDTWAVVNERDGEDILDANGGQVSAEGVLILTLSPEDNEIIDTSLAVGKYEYHRIRVEFEAEVNGVFVTGLSEFDLAVRKLAVPVL